MKLIAALVLIYISQSAFAGSMDSAMSNDRSRDLTTISELIPDIEDLECRPKCEGNAHTANSCGQFTTLDSCLDTGSDQGCFWSCY